MEPFLTATLTNDTPVFLGGYDTQYVRDGISEGLRVQSLKGLLRYWMRAYLAGAGYGLEQINEEVNRICGGKTREEMHSSKIQIKYKINYDEPASSALKDVPRIKLLELGKNRISLTFANKLSASISLYAVNNINDDDKKLVIGSLLTGLLLSGIGKMSRRGFGCFNIKIENDTTRLFRSNIDSLFSTTTIDKRIECIRNIISLTRNSIKGYNINKLPEIHAMHPNYYKIFYLPLTNKSPLTAVKELQGFTVRSLRGRNDNITRERGRNDNITRERLAWFLGLPRSQRGTGYFAKDKGEDVERRASPLFIAVHKDFALVSIFKSSDWPSTIEWRGGYRKSFRLDIDIDKAFNIITESFISYATNKGYKVIGV